MLTAQDIKTITDILKTEILPLKSDIKGLVSKVDGLEKGQSKLEKAIKKEHKLINEVLGVLDTADNKISRRVDRIEQHLGISAMMQ